MMAGSRNNLIVRVGLDTFFPGFACIRFFACAIDIEMCTFSIYPLKFVTTLMVHIDYTIKYYYISASLFFYSINRRRHTKLLCNCGVIILHPIAMLCTRNKFFFIFL